ncbi:transposase family protein [Nostoc sp. XA010]|uniref:transposase family protein n=1 Tax=Nostoc sp. XA010 TaxID=2780407 RepID=UPI001E5ED1A9|nr:transposase family protein [Nostoc sp. XA010]
MRLQIAVDLNTGAVICTAHSQGKRHDFRLFKHSKVRFHPQTLGLADLGYQGITKLHPKSKIPKKKPLGGQLSLDDKDFNRQLAQERVISEVIDHRAIANNKKVKPIDIKELELVM